MPEEIIQTTLRIPKRLHTVLSEWAQDERRSLSAQILTALEEAAHKQSITKVLERMHVCPPGDLSDEEKEIHVAEWVRMENEQKEDKKRQDQELADINNLYDLLEVTQEMSIRAVFEKYGYRDASAIAVCRFYRVRPEELIRQ